MESDLPDLSSMSATQIDELKTQKELELQEASRVMSVAQEESHRIRKEMIDLRGKQQEIEGALDKGRHNLRVINSELRVLTSAYFNALRGHP